MKLLSRLGISPHKLMMPLKKAPLEHIVFPDLLESKSEHLLQHPSLPGKNTFFNRRHDFPPSDKSHNLYHSLHRHKTPTATNAIISDLFTWTSATGYLSEDEKFCPVFSHLDKDNSSGFRDSYPKTPWPRVCRHTVASAAML